MHENVSGARVVKAFGKEDYEYNRFVDTNNDYTASSLYVGKTAAFLINKYGDIENIIFHIDELKNANLRKKIVELNYYIERETLVKDNNIIYTIICFKKGRVQ